MSSHCTICQSESSSWQIIYAEFYLNLKDWERSCEVCFAKFIFLGLGFACLIQEFMSFSLNTNMAQRGQGRKHNFDNFFQGKIRKMINTWLLDIQETQVQRTAIWGRGQIFIAIIEAKKETLKHSALLDCICKKVFFSCWWQTLRYQVLSPKGIWPTLGQSPRSSWPFIYFVQ